MRHRDANPAAQPSSPTEQLNTVEPLLNERQAAELLGISKRALQAWRYRGGGPAFVRLRWTPIVRQPEPFSKM